MLRPMRTGQEQPTTNPNPNFSRAQLPKRWHHEPWLLTGSRRTTEQALAKSTHLQATSRMDRGVNARGMPPKVFCTPTCGGCRNGEPNFAEPHLQARPEGRRRGGQHRNKHRMDRAVAATLPSTCGATSDLDHSLAHSRSLAVPMYHCPIVSPTLFLAASLAN